MNQVVFKIDYQTLQFILFAFSASLFSLISFSNTSPQIAIEGLYSPLNISNKPFCISSLFFIKHEVL